MNNFVASCLTASFVVLAAACGGDDPAPSVTTRAPSGGTPPPATTSRPATTQPSVASPAAVATRPASTPASEPTVTRDPGTTQPYRANADPNPARGIALLQGIRVGAHPEEGGWDRIVFEFKDARPAVEVSYVDNAATCGRGDAVSLPGAAMLSVKFRQTQAHTDAGASTLPSRDITGPGNVILKSSVICDFEGETGVAIGIKTKQPYKVSLLQNPTRVVIDVKQ